MYPVLWQWHGAYLSTYSVLFSLACVLGIVLWAVLGDRRGLPAERLITRGIVGVIVAWFGARALFVLTNWERFGASLSFWKIWEGGIVFYGGALTAGIYLWWSLRRDRVALLPALSALVPGVLLGHAVGRLGCFFNGCCHGAETRLPWGVIFTDPLCAARPLGVPLHPSQLYEFIGLMLLFIFTLNWELRGAKKRHPYWSNPRIYLFGYGGLRFALEFFRGDPYRGAWLALSTSQWISLGVVLFAVLLDLRADQGDNTAP